MTARLARAVCVTNPEVTESTIWKVLEGHSLLDSVITVKIMRGTTSECPQGLAEIRFISNEVAQLANQKISISDGMKILFVEPDICEVKNLKDLSKTGNGLVKSLQTRGRSSANPGRFTNLYLKNIPLEYNEENLKLLFAGYGEITSYRVKISDKGKSKGFGFVNFKKHEDALKAVDDLNGITLPNDKILYIAPFQKRSERDIELRRKYALLAAEEKFYVGQEGVCMLVSNLDSVVLEEHLWQIFRQFGQITSAKIVKGGQMNHGFVRFVSRKAAGTAVIRMHHYELGRHRIDVRLTPRAKEFPKTENSTLTEKSLSLEPPRNEERLLMAFDTLKLSKNTSGAGDSSDYNLAF